VNPDGLRRTTDREMLGFLRVLAGAGFAHPVGMSTEVLFARWLAFCVHPAAAWRRLPASGRLLLAGSYALVSYVTALTALLMF
jgi:hypothetical protein